MSRLRGKRASTARSSAHDCGRGLETRPPSTSRPCLSVVCAYACVKSVTTRRTNCSSATWSSPNPASCASRDLAHSSNWREPHLCASAGAISPLAPGPSLMSRHGPERTAAAGVVVGAAAVALPAGIPCASRHAVSMSALSVKMK